MTKRGVKRPAGLMLEDRGLESVVVVCVEERVGRKLTNS